MSVCVCVCVCVRTTEEIQLEKEESIEGGLGSQYIGWEAVY